jgi:hypothetical protein
MHTAYTKRELNRAEGSPAATSLENPPELKGHAGASLASSSNVGVEVLEHNRGSFGLLISISVEFFILNMGRYLKWQRNHETQSRIRSEDSGKEYTISAIINSLLLGLSQPEVGWIYGQATN